MMRRVLLMLPLLCCLLLTACSRDPVSNMAAGQSEADLPAPAEAVPPKEERPATLWFRFGTEPLLAPEAREIAASPDDALALLQALLEGPRAASAELVTPFPQGTRVLSVSQSGNIMFVTLSRHIMNGYADEPDSWRDDPRWATEVPLRRELAMQSIAATVTENCDADTVVILVEQSGEVTDSLRLRQHYYTLDGDMTLAAPLTRDESLLLTPARTAQVILQAWQESDWARLYLYIARTDPATGVVHPDEDTFAQQMAQEPHLVRWNCEGGSISADGNTAVFTVSGTWLADGTEQSFAGLPLKLTREKGIWRAGLSQLAGREALP